MKITNKSKKPATLPAPVADFVANLLNAPDEQLVYILGSVETWKWPRSDLNAWIKVLNKFDAILEEIINQYELDKVQLVTFPSQTKALVSEILRFHRLLLENSTNRKSFNSYDRLNSLLLCSDLDIVLLSLNVLLRPAQQYSSQSSVSHVLNLSTPRLLALARRWPHLREYGINLIDLVSNKRRAEVEGVAVDAREVSYSFYKMDGGATQSMKEEVPEVPETPSNASVAPSVGPINVYISEAVLQTQTPMKILADCVRQYRVPDEEKFELLSRIRVAQALYKGHESEREKLVIARLLSIAIYAHTHTESQATSTFFLYEPDLISNVAELLHVEHDVSLTVQTAAIAVLDAFTRYRNRCQEVLAAVNAGVNHGILMALFRKTVNDIASPNSETPQSFIEALIQFVNLIAAHTSGVNMIIGAGLIPLLLQMVENKLSNRLPIVSKTMQLIDSVLYAFPNGFTIFCAARGVTVLVDRIQHEVDYGIQEYGQHIPLYEVNPLDNELPVARTSLLKHLLRTMHRMMQSNGLAEGLRGLIDTSLVKSVKKIIDNRGLFGPTVLPLAINIMATFVHNEPTSLGIIQEAGLPESFYKAIEVGIEPSIEVIQSIPNGLGALCLNETGQAQLNNRPSIIPSIFTIFTSEKHMKVLLDKESAVIIGAAIDELVRHHPLLKAAVFASLKSIMSSLVEIGTSYEVPSDLLHWYQLIPSVIVTSDNDVKMEDVGRPSSASKEMEATDVITDASSEDQPSKTHENIVVSYIDVLCRFLEGFFQHAPHCKDFINLSDGLVYLGKLTALPSLPYDFSNSVASDSLVQVMRTLVDFVTNETLIHLGKIIRDSLQDTKEFWQEFDQSSKLLPFLEINDSNNDDHNGRFRSLVTLHIRISLLSDVFGTVGYSHGRGAIALLQTLMESGSGQTIPELGALHRATIWENITLNAALTSRGILQASSSSLSLDGTPNDPTINVIEPSTSLNSGQTSANGIEPDAANVTTQENQDTKSNQDETPLARNAAALKYITHGVPNVLAPLFQAIVKMLHARRNPEAPQKKQIMESGTVIADIMIKHLQIPQLEDISSLYIYYSVVLGLFNLIFVDERTSTNTLHSVALLSFYKKGGFDEILRVCSSLTDSIKDITDMCEEDRTDKSNKVLIQAYGTIKVALNFVYPIISSKPLFESPQTLLLITRDKKETDPGFFDPNNFLVKLRLKVLPLLRLLWEASWLVRAPLPVSKAIVRAVLEVVNAENEQSKPETTTENTAPQPSRPSGPDENRVQMLVDMGFSRAAAEHALTQTRNNVNAATDFLLAHPFAFPVDHEPTEPQDDNNNANANNNNDVPIIAEGQEQSSDAPEEPLAETGDSSVNESSEQDQVKEVTKTTEEWRQILDEARSPLRETISRQALLLIDEHQSLLFELHSIFVRSGAQQPKAIRDLIDDIKSFSPSANDIQEQPLANRCRLLALVLTETPSSLDDAFKAELLERLLTLMLSGVNPENPPKWLASHLLVTEALLILSDEPRTITLPKEDEAITPELLSNGLSRPDAKTIVFNFCLRLLAVKDLPSHEYLSVLRLLVYFTRDRQFVKQFVESDGIGHILRRLGTSDLTGGSVYIIIILRHVIEDHATVHDIMLQSIKRYFAHPRSNLVDVATYIRNCNSMAFRDTDIFIEVTKSLCTLNFAYAYNPHITLKEEKKDKTKEGGEKNNEGKPAGISGDDGMQMEPITNVLSASGEQYAETVVHMLISELMGTIKAINEPTIKQTSTSAIPPIVSSTTEQPSPLDAQQVDLENSASLESDVDNKNQYACFLMQCLTELLFSYDACKVAFLSYTPKRRNQTPAKESANKLRTATVQFLLNDVINPGTINPSPSEKVRQHLKLCHWAMLIIVSLCVDTSASPQEAKEVSPELVAVRKFVLETVNRSLKDISSIENLEVRYGRLLAYADLCHRLLVIRFNTPSASNRKQQDEVPTHISKIMLEKNFVATLTTALSEVDLNYPNIRNLVASVLRPLQYLTKIAIKMSRGTKNKEFTDAKKDDSTSSSLSSQEDDDSDDMSEDAREATPDLYRNSALGMYAGEMDDGQYSGSDEMDEDGEDEEDVEMDYGEATGSEATSEATDDSEDDELEEDEPEEGEEWDEVDEEEQEDIEEQDLIENNDDDDEEDDVIDEEDLEEEADEDGNLLWEDIPPPHESGLGAIGEDMDEEEEHITIPIMRHEEEDADMASDDEGFRFENGIFSADSAFPFGGSFINITTGQHPPPVFMSRRNRSENDDLQVFGRARNAPPPPETITHPLLLDTSSNSTRLPSNVRRGPRHSTRSIAIMPDIFHSIDDIMGPGSTQYIQQILATASGGTHAFHLDMGNMINFDRLHRRPTQGIISAAIRVERGPRGQTTKHGREFDPLLTLQRWAEEVKILNGEFVSDRSGKLVNHVILALLPAAAEAKRKANEQKEAEEKAAAEKEENKVDVEIEEPKREVEPILHPEGQVPAVNAHEPEPPTPADSVPVDVQPPHVDEPMETASIDQDTPMSDATTAETNEVDDTHGGSAEVATTSQVQERVTVMIHGSLVDITDTGIDPTFLEALPDDMREEVLNQHVRDQRAAIVERPPDSQISAEFLEALPPEIRAEIIQQEAIERARQRAEEVAAQPAQAAEVDPASFIANFDPSLRQSVLLEQNEGFLQSLPPHILAETGDFQGGSRRLRVSQRTPRAPGTGNVPRKYAMDHDAIQLLDKPGIAALVRLLFFPQVSKKNLLFKVLVNLCENAKTRTELFNILLGILQDGPGDLSAVDKSFSQLTVRNTKPPATPKSLSKQKATSEFIGTLASPNARIEAVPDLIVQRCLESLTYIVSANELSSLFFLTEHELPPGLRRPSSKKGKGKEKQVPQSHYPIVLLLGLLDRQSLIRTPAIMEAVVGLLATVTRPLASLKAKDAPQVASTSTSMDKPLSTVLENVDHSLPQTTAESQQTTLPPVLSTTEPSIPSSKEPKASLEALEEKILLANPPQIPHAVLCLIVNILTVGECSGRTFQQSLGLIQHLSYIPDAREVIAQELRSKAEEFGHALYIDLDALATALQGPQEELNAVAAKFSPASSLQAKLLRVLKTIDYMYSSKAASPSATEMDIDKVQAIYESFRFTPLWRRLGDCLSIIEEKPETEHIAIVLLPLIEALMVVCKYAGTKSSPTTVPRALRGSVSPRSPTTPRESMEDLFISFTDSHRKVLNVMVRNNPSLMSGSFALLVNNPRVLDFDNKRNYFNQQLHRRPQTREHYGTLQLNVRRARVFEDSFQYLQRKSGDQIKYGKMNVRFYDEEGVDAGGVTREWFQILARQMFDPNNALFQPCAADKLTYQPNKNSWVNPEHLSFFKFVGRVIGKAIYDGRLLDAYFARSLYRQILGKPVDYRDVEWVDPEYYKSLCWILENDPAVLDLNFSVEADEFGVNRIVPLKENGESIVVTNENKREFVQLSAQYRLVSSIKEQIENMLNGFYEIIPKDLVTIFNEQELELLISGTPDIDVDEWRAATEYNGYTSSDPNIVWWWRALKSFNREERAKVLSFATGTSRVPLSGFVDLQGVQGVQRFSIHRAYGEPDRLPQAHTCFNQIDLPQYSSYEMLREKLLLAINEGGEGFAFS